MQIRAFLPSLKTLGIIASLWLCGGWPQVAAQPAGCSYATSGVLDCSGQTLITPQFSHQNLRGAKFANAVLIGAVFVRADLTDADFTNARFKQQTGKVPQSDFSFANLTRTNFTDAQFLAPTYFTYAYLTSTDFSNTDISTPNAIFGDEAITFDATAAKRPSFAGATLNCEFVAQWPAMNLTNAKGLTACGSKLKSVVWKGAVLDGADLTGADLRGTAWDGASLVGTIFSYTRLDGATGFNAKGTVASGAYFSHASARYVDFSGGTFFGAVFSNADLEGANFAGTSLVGQTNIRSGSAASFEGAHLKNASFAGTTLNSVSFKYASLYGSGAGFAATPAASCTLASASGGCPAAYPKTGATCSCATMRAADLTRTNFSNAFLYGVDFSTKSTNVNGTTFDNAILVASNFAGATFAVDNEQGGGPPSLETTLLHGVDLSAANLASALLSNAFVDFGAYDRDNRLRVQNALSLLLGSQYTDFPNWSGRRTPCVLLPYKQASNLPTAIASMRCPDTNTVQPGCDAMVPRGSSTPVNPHWWNGNALAANAPAQGWYQADSTYEKATTDSSQVCQGQPIEPAWFPVNAPN
jgi:uncharacterized protein YjbI with pentapeptide repeats